MPDLFTLGDLAKRLDASKERINYVIRTRNVTYIGRAGHFRLFDEAAAKLIAKELRRIDARRPASCSEAAS